jgi:hypothetical protein
LQFKNPFKSIHTNAYKRTKVIMLPMHTHRKIDLK